MLSPRACPLSLSALAAAQAVADVFVKDEWSPQIALQKMEYQMEKHDAIVRSAMQLGVDALVERWIGDQEQLQQVRGPPQRTEGGRCHPCVPWRRSLAEIAG